MNLKHFELMAKKILMSNGSSTAKTILKDPDLFSNFYSDLALAAWSYKPEKGPSLQQWIRCNFIWKLKDACNDLKKQKKVKDATHTKYNKKYFVVKQTAEDEFMGGELVRDILGKTQVSERDKQIAKEVIVEGKTLRECALLHSLSKERVRQVVGEFTEQARIDCPEYA